MKHNMKGSQKRYFGTMGLALQYAKTEQTRLSPTTIGFDSGGIFVLTLNKPSMKVDLEDVRERTEALEAVRLAKVRADLRKG